MNHKYKLFYNLTKKNQRILILEGQLASNDFSFILNDNG